MKVLSTTHFGLAPFLSFGLDRSSGVIDGVGVAVF